MQDKKKKLESINKKCVKLKNASTNVDISKIKGYKYPRAIQYSYFD